MSFVVRNSRQQGLRFSSNLVGAKFGTDEIVDVDP